MQRITLLAACALVAACHRSPTEGGIQANVHIDSDAFVTCLQLSALDTSGNTLGTTSTTVNGAQLVSFAVTQGDYPADISIHVVGLYSASGCDEPALPNAQPADLTGLHFKPGVTQVDLTIHKPGSADDVDGDGFTSVAKGGPDCDDTNPSANPSADERCSDLVDLNCNGKYGCDDPACTGKTCLSPPAALAFASSPQSAAAQICSGAIVVELHDATGAAVPAGANTTVKLAEMGNLGLNVYSDSGCTVPAMSADIAKGQRQVRFYAKGGKAGTTQLQATATGLTQALQAFVVAPGAATAVFFTTAPQTVKADRCSTAVTLEARDLQMNAAPVAADVAYTVTPVTGVSLFSDATCATALGAAKIASGTPSATFYFKPARAPGMVMLNVTAAPLTGATQTETIDPGDPATLKFTTNPQMVGAGVCSGAMAVQLVDSHGTNTTPAPGMTVTLSGPSFTFFTDASCATPANGSAMFSPTTGAATVYFRATTTGMSMVTASGGGLPNVTQAETIAAGPPTQLVFQNATTGAQSSTCTGPDALTVKDQFGNTATVTGVPLTIQLKAVPSTGFTFYAAGACGSPITSVQIPVNQSSVGFNFIGTVANPVTVTAMSALAPDPTQNINVGVGAANKLVFTTMPQTKKANACSAAVTLQAQDMGGNVVSVLSPLTISLMASPSTGFMFFSDASCGTQVSQVVMPMGGSQATYWFRGTTMGAVTMTTSSSLVTNPTQVATIAPEVASALVFTNMPLTVTAGACSPALTLQSRDGYTNPSPVAADTPVMLTALPSSNITFFSDMGCNTAVMAVTLPMGMSTVPFYVKANTAPSYTLQANGGVLGSALPQTLTVSPAAASGLVILTSTQMKNTGQCSAAVTVQRQDAFSNPVTAGTTSVMFSQSPAGGGLQFFTDMNCTASTSSVSIGPGASTANVFFRGTLPGMPTLIAGSGSLTQASQPENINVSPPGKLVFTSAQQNSVPAGSCSAIVTVQSQDSLGNASPVGMDTPLVLGAPPANGGFYVDPGCTIALSMPKLTNGMSNFNWYFKGTTALPFMLSASAAGLSGAMQNAAIVAGAVSQLAITTLARTASTGACSQVLTVQRQDTYGNAVTSGPMMVTLSASPSTNFTFSKIASCSSSTSSVSIADTFSTADFYFSGTVPGPVQVTAAAGGSVTSAMQGETVAMGSPMKVAFTTPNRTPLAGACSKLTVQSQDNFGNPAPVGAGGVTLTLSGTNLTFFQDMGCTMGQSNPVIPMGMTDASFFAADTVAVATSVVVNAGGLGNVMQPFTVSAAPAAKLFFTTGQQSVLVGGCSTVATVQTQDPYGNLSPVSAMTTLTPTVMAPGTVTFFSDACTTPLASGVTLMSGDSAGSYFMKGGATMQMGTVTVNATPFLTAASQMVTVQIGPPAKLKFVSTPPNLMAGECSGAVTVQLQDLGGNTTSSTTTSTTVNLSALPSTGFAFYSDMGCTNPVGSVIIPPNSSAANVYVKGITGGSVNMTAADAATVLASDTQMAAVLSAVQTGSCPVSGPAGAVTCPIGTPLRDVTKTFLLFQAANNNLGPNNSQVRCELTNTTTITCSRGGSGGVAVRWYTVSLPTGLKVQHINGQVAAGSGNPQVQIIPVSPPVANVSDSFVLLSTDFAGTQYNNQALTTARLTSTSQVTLTRLAVPGSLMTHSLQVVEWTGSTVVHGATSLNNNATLINVTGLADTTTTPTFLLSTFRWDDMSTNEICRQSIQGSLVGTTGVAFARATGVTGNCNNNQIDIEFERVQLPSNQRVDVLASMPVVPANGSSVALGSPVDLTRSVPFFSIQGIAGQASGECADTTVDRPRDCLMNATFTDSTTISAQRVSAGGDAGFTLFMLQVTP